MQSYAEGFALLKAGPYAEHHDLARICDLWQRGSVVRSWLLELLGRAFSADPHLEALAGYVEDSGEGRWTVQQALDSATSANVSHQSMTARRGADGLRIEPSGADPYVISGDALPLTHWNRFAYQGPLFDPQAGKLLKLSLVSRGDDMVQLADGSSVKAVRWTVAGDGMMDDYYDANGVWTGLHVKVQDGSQVQYLRL